MELIGHRCFNVLLLPGVTHSCFWLYFHWSDVIQDTFICKPYTIAIYIWQRKICLVTLKVGNAMSLRMHCFYMRLYGQV